MVLEIRSEEAIPEVRSALAEHDPSIPVHTNLVADECCRTRVVVPERPRASQTGEFCIECGGGTQRTGTCTTCIECGWSGGCG